MQDKDTEKLIEDFKKINEDGFFTISDIEYKLEKIPFAKRRKLYAFFMYFISNGGFTVLGSEEFEKVEPILLDYTTVNGLQLSKYTGYFDKKENMRNYSSIIISTLGGFVYPFLGVE